MIVTVETKNLGPIAVELDVPVTLEGLVEQYGSKAVYHAVIDRSLTDKVRDCVRGAVARGIDNVEAIVELASQVRLLPPTTRTAEEIQVLFAKLSESPDDDLAIALASMTQEQKDAIIARLVG